MRLLDAILDANQRRLAGDPKAMVPVAELAAALPMVALTCIDARLNHLLPDALGVPEEQFIWTRNAGNIVTGPLSSTSRSLALACAVKGGREIAIIGHTDCQVGKTTMLELLDRLGKIGVDRSRLPENLVEYFGLFGSERQNVLRAVEFVRASPLIGTKVPVHGLMLDLSSGRIECVTNGYEAAPPALSGPAGELFARANKSLDALVQIGNAADELKMPMGRIGDVVSIAHDWLHKAELVAAAVLPAAPAPGAPAAPPVVTAKPLPDPLVTLQERTRQLAGARPPRKR